MKTKLNEFFELFGKATIDEEQGYFGSAYLLYRDAYATMKKFIEENKHQIGFNLAGMNRLKFLALHNHIVLKSIK